MLTLKELVTQLVDFNYSVFMVLEILLELVKLLLEDLHMLKILTKFLRGNKGLLK